MFIQIVIKDFDFPLHSVYTTAYKYSLLEHCYPSQKLFVYASRLLEPTNPLRLNYGNVILKNTEYLLLEMLQFEERVAL